MEHDHFQIGTVQEISSSPKTVIWKIGNFQELQRLICYTSPEFLYSGGIWRLLLYPKGLHTLRNCILLILSGNSTGSVYWELGVKTHDGTILKRSCGFRGHKEALENEAPLAVRARTRDSFLREESLVITSRSMKWACTSSGCLTVICKLYNVEEAGTNTEASSLTAANLGTMKLASDLKGLMLGGEDSNVTIRVGRHEFRAHSAILVARIPAFASMFKYDMTEKVTGIVDIDDCDAGVFQVFLQYVYTGTVEHLSTENVFGLFAVADKYLVHELKANCLQYMKDMLTVDTFCDILAFAMQYVNWELLESSVDFLSEKLDAIMKLQKWQELLSVNPMMCNEILLEAMRRQKGQRADIWELDFERIFRE